MSASVMDVLVIGCGASGVAALRKLHDAGLKVLGLEADDRIGGRIKSIPYGDCYLDVGAAWCHGEKENIVFEMANPLGLLGRPKPHHKWYVQSNGELLSADNCENILKALDDEVAAAKKDGATSIADCVRTAAKRNPALKRDSKLTQSFVEWFEKNNHLGGQREPCTAKSLRGLVENWGCEGEFMLNWKGKGYKTIFDILLNKYPDPSKEIPIQIHFKKEVETIKWRSTQGTEAGSPLVQVKCTDGSLYTARSVIVTVSLGVLKERHHHLFNPRLPEEKINTINSLQLCVLDKIYIEFTKAWWPEFPGCFTILWREDDKGKFSGADEWITEISGFNTVEYHPNLLLAWIYGTAAEKMEKLSVDEVKAGLHKLLEMFKKQFKVTPIKCITRTQWASNPLARGSYSYRSVATEQNGASATILGKPLYHGNNFPVVCFAGEASSHHRHASVHGAVEAGFREAARLIDTFNNKTYL
ncbi:unnamed protein product [Leptidea sinapis]|uniref:Amine oxidase domain-containing protein n=1 Tax=Leptidea sinapis TaxID=189913 RepID=A0A5E4QM07_9NEOP|nr:unnamed protein product [Leptidea sinapis]